MNSNSADVLKLLTGLGLNYFGKRSNDEGNDRIVDLKLLNGFGFSKLGKRWPEDKLAFKRSTKVVTNMPNSAVKGTMTFLVARLPFKKHSVN